MKKVAKNYTGYSKDSQAIPLGAGAFFRDFEYGVDTYETAKASGKCLGATKGGGNFSAIPAYNYIEFDGVGKQPELSEWKVTLTANVAEQTQHVIMTALGAAHIETSVDGKYDIIRAKQMLDIEDFISNLTWIGKRKDTDLPIIIQIFNAISTSGLKIDFKPSDQSVIEMTFEASVSADGEAPDDEKYAPFKYFSPKTIQPVKIDSITSISTKITGRGLIGAKVYITGGTIPENANTTISEDGTFLYEMENKQSAGTIIKAYQQLSNGIKSNEAKKTVIIAKEEEPEEDVTE